MLLRPALAVLAVLVSAGCTGSGSARPNAADRTFLQEMIAHHQRAIEVGRLASAYAGDPRAVAFGRRIVEEQSPELARMKARVAAEQLSVDLSAGARMARNRITDAQRDNLTTLHGTAFDTRFLALNIVSEQGAAAMARIELASGTDPATRKLAKAIASAPNGEIPQLQTLLSTLS